MTALAVSRSYHGIGACLGQDWPVGSNLQFQARLHRLKVRWASKQAVDGALIAVVHHFIRGWSLMRIVGIDMRSWPGSLDRGVLGVTIFTWLSACRGCLTPGTNDLLEPADAADSLY